jgi:hypothetical protein
MRTLTALLRKRYLDSHGVAAAEISRVCWRKSSLSNMNGSCVEIGRLLSDRIGVRDTKDNGAGAVLIFTDAEWTAFIAGAKSGQFERL